MNIEKSKLMKFIIEEIGWRTVLEGSSEVLEEMKNFKYLGSIMAVIKGVE